MILQQRFKAFYARKVLLDAENRRFEEVHREEKRLNDAARTIQYNLKACLFNYEMSKFILVCCIHYRTEYDLQTWHATVLQRRWRGFVVRLRRHRARTLWALRHRAAVRIQSSVRRRICRRRFLPRRMRLRAMCAQWARLVGGRRRVRLRLGLFARRIQRLVRRYVLRQALSAAATVLQRVLRGHLCRLRHHDTIFSREIAAATKMQRLWRGVLARRRRRALHARRHMAVYKIQAMVWRFFHFKRVQRERALALQIQQKLNNDKKKELAMQRREKVPHSS